MRDQRENNAAVDVMFQIRLVVYLATPLHVELTMGWYAHMSCSLALPTRASEQKQWKLVPSHARPTRLRIQDATSLSCATSRGIEMVRELDTCDRQI